MVLNKIGVLELIGVFGAVATKYANMTSIPLTQIRNNKNATHDDIIEDVINATHIDIIKIIIAIEIGVYIINVIIAKEAIMENRMWIII